MTKNKNIDKTIEIVKKFRSYLPSKLTIIGSGEISIEKLLKEMLKNSDFITYKEKISNRNELLQYYRSADIFIMPSKTETFGLVYAEAMSQGLPCLYSIGQGIDGYFEDGYVGYAINANDIDESVAKIVKIIENYSIISKNCISSSSLFHWDSIAEKFSQLYTKLD